MKRIAALAALALALLAIPASAMASTGSSGPGQGSPRQVTIICRAPSKLLHKGHVKVVRIGPGKLPPKILARLLKKNRHLRIACPFLPAPPRGCPTPAQILRFDVASGSSTLTEVSGPVLSPTQEFSYEGNVYTIMSVNPGADSFTAFVNNLLFVNHGPAITDGLGLMACSR